MRSRGVKTDPPLGPESPLLGRDGAEPPLGLVISSAGSGTGVMAVVAGASASPVTASEATVSSADFPLAALTGVAGARFALGPLASERELPVLVRDDDMELLSTTASVSANSASASLTCGAIMNGDCVLDPASSTPSSSVPTGPLCNFVRDYPT